jgi:FAD/FMN-containing dehydrogenase
MEELMEPENLNPAAAGGSLPFADAIASLGASLRGEIIDADNEAFDERRAVWNGTIDRRPRLIVRARGVADVRAALALAREYALPVSVRGGGHNVAGSAVVEDGVVIDLSLMRGVRIDPERRIAEVDGGALIGDVDTESQVFGLAAPFGVVSETGIAGLTLHGGLGFLSRRYGLSCDNLVGADVVTADGSLVHASLESNSDLLWALRGGGGNFGVVTRFEYRLHPVGPEVFMVITMYPLDQAVAVVDAFRQFVETAPQEFSGICVFWTTPEGEPVVEENRGQPTVIIAGCWSGDLAEGERILAPLRSITTPLADLSGPLPFTIAQTLFDPEFPPGQRHYWRSLFLDRVDDEIVAMAARQTLSRPSLMSSIDIWALGGKLREEPVGGSAYAQRDRPYLLAYEANWQAPEDDAANIAWTKGACDEAAVYSSGGVYLNFPGFEDERASIIDATYGEKLARLREIKAKYDPQNVFRSNINVAPAGMTVTVPEMTVRSGAVRS